MKIQVHLNTSKNIDEMQQKYKWPGMNCWSSCMKLNCCMSYEYSWAGHILKPLYVSSEKNFEAIC